MNTTNQTGTTLAILAPYLPYEIEVQHPGYGRGKLSSIHAGGARHSLPLKELVVDYEPNQLLSCDSVLPVLRPFTALCDPLPDGTVPALEVAKLALVLAPENSSPAQRLYVDPQSKPEPYISVIAERERSYDLEIILRPDWSVGLVYDWATVPGSNGGAIYDYLRSIHFAVGLEPHQYVVK